VARRQGDAFVDPRPLRINSRGSESHPALSPDGRLLVFQAYRELGAVGEEDLYVSERTAYGWGAPRPLPEPINSPDNDGYPSFSPDGRYLFFASDRGPGRSWSIYWVEAAALGRFATEEDP
jgi:Tol biopolymer transport system component